MFFKLTNLFDKFYEDCIYRQNPRISWSIFLPESPSDENILCNATSSKYDFIPLLNHGLSYLFKKGKENFQIFDKALLEG